jgi:hypothetical protein
MNPQSIQRCDEGNHNVEELNAEIKLIKWALQEIVWVADITWRILHGG